MTIRPSKKFVTDAGQQLTIDFTGIAQVIGKKKKTAGCCWYFLLNFRFVASTESEKARDPPVLPFSFSNGGSLVIAGPDKRFITDSLAFIAF